MSEDAAQRSGEGSEKVPFASHAWLRHARVILAKLVAEHGVAGKSFSVCEVFTDAPAGLVGPDDNIAAWHFRISGKSVSVGEGEIEGADMEARVDYEEVLPRARMVYTPQMLEQLRKNPPDSSIDRSNVPAYLVELHNRLAVITA